MAGAGSLKRGLAGAGLAVLLAGCAGSDSLPKTPTIAAARSCLQRHGMSSKLVTTTKLRPITLASARVATPVAELDVLHGAAPRTRLLIAYFASAATATAAEHAVNPNAAAFRTAPAGALEVQQATAGKDHGRVLVIEFHAQASNQSTLFTARYCTTRVPIPKATHAANG